MKKSKWKSKTWWASLITAVGGVATFFIPEASEWVSDNSEGIVTIIGIVFAVLRINTNTGVK